MYTDLSYLRQITKNNYEVIILTIDKFTVSIPQSISNIKKAQRIEDYDTIGSEAHKLLSSVGILKIDKMEKLVRRLESNCKDKENLEEVPGLVDEVKEKSRYVIKELEGIRAGLEKDPASVTRF